MLSEGDCVQIIGLCSSALIAIMFIPQIYHVYRSREADSLNYIFLLFNSLSSAMGMIYSFYFSVLPMFLANISAMCSSVTLVYLKYKYSNMIRTIDTI